MDDRRKVKRLFSEKMNLQGNISQVEKGNALSDPEVLEKGNALSDPEISLEVQKVISDDRENLLKHLTIFL